MNLAPNMGIDAPEWLPFPPDPPFVPRVSAQCQVPRFSPTPRNNVMPSLKRNPGLRKKLSEGPHSCMQVPGWGTQLPGKGIAAVAALVPAA
jgi:hypothetical protein